MRLRLRRTDSQSQLGPRASCIIQKYTVRREGRVEAEKSAMFQPIMCARLETLHISSVALTDEQ